VVPYLHGEEVPGAPHDVRRDEVQQQVKGKGGPRGLQQPPSPVLMNL